MIRQLQRQGPVFWNEALRGIQPEYCINMMYTPQKIPKPYGLGYFFACVGRIDAVTSGFPKGSEGSAAGGGRSDLSEWQRSAAEEAAASATKMPGTATGRRLKCAFHNQKPKGGCFFFFARKPHTAVKI